MNKVGITGASGILGKLFVAKLKGSGLECSCFEGDILEKKNIKDWLKENNLDAMIHFAAIVSIKEVKKNPEKAYLVNVEGTKNLINEIKLSGQNPWLFYASTSHVYKSKDSPISEDDEAEPISIYGKTKYEAEKFVTQNYENACIGRIFSMYHDSQQRPFLYPNILYRLKHEDLTKPFKLYGANSVRDFLSAEKVSEIIFQLMNRKATGIYNIASGNGIKIRDFIQNLSDEKLEIKEMSGQDYLVADINKLNKVLSN